METDSAYQWLCPERLRPRPLTFCAQVLALNRRLDNHARRANDEWETKHIFGFALREPVVLPPPDNFQSPRP